MNQNQTPDRLRRSLLERLRPLATGAGQAPTATGFRVRGRQLFSYCCVSTERLNQVTIAHSTIGIVLSGTKEFWLGDAGQRFSPGDIFVLPAGAELDAVNMPDERSGLYEALLVEVPRLPATLAQMPLSRISLGQASGIQVPGTSPSPVNSFNFRVTLTHDLVDALAHAATTLARSDHAETLAEHRLAEVLMLLRADPAARCLFAVSLGDRIGWMVMAEPTRRWTADEIAAKLGIGASTLRRRLTADGTSLRGVLAIARMQIARGMLARGEANVTAAAEAAGYASRSHFIRRFRSVFGSSPSEHRARRA